MSDLRLINYFFKAATGFGLTLRNETDTQQNVEYEYNRSPHQDSPISQALEKSGTTLNNTGSFTAFMITPSHFWRIEFRTFPLNSPDFQVAPAFATEGENRLHWGDNKYIRIHPDFESKLSPKLTKGIKSGTLKKLPFDCNSPATQLFHQVCSSPLDSP
ncbi:MAG: hypothetical protein R3C11_06450 [Planctomycetaceae bacterium]